MDDNGDDNAMVMSTTTADNKSCGDYDMCCTSDTSPEYVMVGSGNEGNMDDNLMALRANGEPTDPVASKFGVCFIWTSTHMPSKVPSL